MEKELIKQYNSNLPSYGYNLSSGGESGGAGIHPSKETIEKRASKLRGRKLSEEHRLKLSQINKERLKDKKNNPRYGKKLSEEQKEKLRESAKNRKPITEETREKLSKSHLGHVHSEATRKKISNSNKGKKCSEETKLKISKKLKGRVGHKHSEETKQKIGKASKSRKVSEETKMKRRETAYNKKSVAQYDIDNNFINTYISMNEASHITGVPASNIGKCISGERKHAGGYIWKHIE